MIDLRFSHEVKAARDSARPIVALESAIIAHGLPRPENLETARRCESIIREEGAVPATLAFRDGAALVGLEPDTLEALAAADSVAKVNLANLAGVLSHGGWGAATVSASLWTCHRADLPVLVTGGIGGVHRGFAESFDISSDLTALARFPVLVVCSGVKSLLDIAATREHLETLGVPIVGYQTDTLPRFYIRESAYPVDARADTPEDAARIARLHWEAGGAGIVLGVPVPPDDEVIEAKLEEALAEAEYDRRHSPTPIEGRAVTPFILAALVRHTHGATLRANLALIHNNSRIAARLAKALAGH